VQLFIVLSVAI